MINQLHTKRLDALGDPLNGRPDLPEPIPTPETPEPETPTPDLPPEPIRIPETDPSPDPEFPTPTDPEVEPIRKM